MVLLKTKRSQETLIHPLDFLYPHSATSQVSHDALCFCPGLPPSPILPQLVSPEDASSGIHRHVFIYWKTKENLSIVHPG